ncbi:MAG: DNA alkylation repair protein, partial [Leptospiraceae bacterium]|nr:DNA alkylation repair protein [Leptospiraceae bacterium]
MPEPLKYMYNREFVEGLALDIQKVYKQYQVDKFIQSVLNKDWDKKELKERMRHISNNLKEFLPDDYSKALKILVETTKLHRIKKAELEKIDFCDLVFPDFVEVNGLDYFDISLDALEEFTKVSSSEGAIRHFILKDQKNTFKRIMKWSKGSNLMVRRLASEGCRPRLPWTIGLKELQKDPTPIIPILENLVLDSSEFVRRSVANNLNDISKDNPNVVIDFIKKWKGKNKDTDRLLKHGARTLLKKGNIEVLSLFGFASKSKRIEISNFELKKQKIKNGEDLLFS